MDSKDYLYWWDENKINVLWDQRAWELDGSLHGPLNIPSETNCIIEKNLVRYYSGGSLWGILLSSRG